MKTIILSILITLIVFAQGSNPVRNIFMQGNNINTVFRTDGIFNYDWVNFPTKEAGFVWPASAPYRMTADYAAGIWIGAKVGPNKELRVAASIYASHFTPGIIPFIGQVPPRSVCNDTSWRGYLVQLTDYTLINGGIRTKTAGGRIYTFNYDSWTNWPVSKGAPYAEINGIPGYQPGWNGDRPGIGNGSKARPDELLFMVYMDYTNCTNSPHIAEVSLPGGSLPLGVEIQLLSFMFNCFSLKDMYFVKYKIINKSSLIWDSTYFAICDDTDIGDGACGASDDANGCDTLRNLSFVYNGDNFDCNYGNNPPALGLRLLQSPLKFTGIISDTVILPYDTLIGYKLIGMTAHSSFKNFPECYSDPDTSIAAYYFMKGLDGCGNPMINWVTNQTTTFLHPGDACNRIGWFDSVNHDSKNFFSSGPFTMTSNDTQLAVISVTVTRDGGNNFQNVCALQSMSDSALKYYYNDFQTCIPIGLQPISNEVPEKFALYQNYPNPFNPTTKIRFSIPPVGAQYIEPVQLKVYDILGREITTLINEQLQPGTYEVEWNAGNYPSGVYFYSMQTIDFTDTKKMVIIK